MQPAEVAGNGAADLAALLLRGRLGLRGGLLHSGSLQGRTRQGRDSVSWDGVGRQLPRDSLTFLLALAFFELPLPPDLGAAFFALLFGVFAAAGAATSSGCAARGHQGEGSRPAGGELLGGG